MATHNDKLLTASEAAEMLALDAKTVLAGRSGTERLTRVRIGRRGVRFLKSEVQALIAELVNEARRRREDEEKKKAERQRITPLRLVPPDGGLAERIIAPFRR
ncbi:MAG TPA: hypothetical protein PLD20_05690 [Blastocatellia bacterium]|nr:hypothetical protein [Blastocatellia bacterium]HMX25680.1 hypothetical protein [Blastocatellia bacterium]HMZ17399.1 hypothetical protein [Blastocatellia bacterium]HNG29229.1 hypothetical protein [Blastocatellia bacterium]